MSARPQSVITLGLCTILHAFTHAYGSMLAPLYLMMATELNLPGIAAASWIVTVYSLTYCLMSFAAGMLADRFDRKMLLGVGLVGNAFAVMLMGLTHQYSAIMALAVLAGVS